ncbi:hypothetical protein HY212_07740 [Candidatus Pacearchaeota archaeon]|nr:hypothetical protein [Candidatus Pacearchaeota archaeon]
MLEEKTNPKLIMDVNQELKYDGHYDVRGINSSRNVNFPARLRKTFQERGKILLTSRLACCRGDNEGYNFWNVWDYTPDLPNQRKFYPLTISKSGEILYFSVKIDLKKRDLTFLGMGNRIELWYREDLENYLKSQKTRSIENPLQEFGIAV